MDVLEHQRRQGNVDDVDVERLVTVLFSDD